MSMADEHQSKFNYSMFHFSRGLIWGVDGALYLSVQGRARESGEERGSQRGGLGWGGCWQETIPSPDN